ncbi:MAG: ParB/RepB/Spo0J family partition protein [Chitinophagaceae bacterium]
MEKIKEPSNPSRDQIQMDSLMELAESIKTRGLLQPIIVYPVSDGYEIEAGHRRYLAVKILGWSIIDAIVKDYSDEGDLHLDRAHENLVRADLNPVEESRIVWDLVNEDGRGIDKVCKMLCKTVSWINSRLEIAKFPDDVKLALSLNKIKIAVAKELTKVSADDTRLRLLDAAVEYGASAAVVAQWCSDSQVGDFLMNKELQQVEGDCVCIKSSQVNMPCRICDITHNIDILRHIWICPECMGAMRELSRETQKQLKLMNSVAEE